MLNNGTLKKGDTIVGTVMTNLGLEHYLKKLGLNLVRTQVGDRYIVEEMKKIGAILGGEPSGHIILLNHSTTGDGTLAALKMIEGMKDFGKPLSVLEKEVLLFPQVIKNAVVSKKIPLESVKLIQEKLESVTKLLGSKGRVLLRYSGTEPLARVMVEGEDQEQVVTLCEELSDVVSTELK